MAWEAPMTWISGELAAADLNKYLRDNMLETAVAKAQQRGGYFASDGANSIVQRKPKKAVLNSTYTTSSTSYVDGTGPELTFESSGNFVLFYSARMYCSGFDRAHMGAKVDGGTAAAEAYDLMATVNSTDLIRSYAFRHFTGEASGEITVRAQYRVTGGTGNFAQRSLIVWPF